MEWRIYICCSTTQMGGVLRANTQLCLKRADICIMVAGLCQGETAFVLHNICLYYIRTTKRGSRGTKGIVTSDGILWNTHSPLCSCACSCYSVSKLEVLS